MLEASLLEAEHDELAAAAARASCADAKRRRRRPTGERNRAGELRDKLGWAWLRVFRRYDEYEAAVAARAGRRGARERELSGVN